MDARGCVSPSQSACSVRKKCRLSRPRTTRSPLKGLGWRFLPLLCVAPVSSAGKTYYEVLGLDRSATCQDARRQFRKLSVKLHPDKNPAADTEAGRRAYGQLQVASEWLSNDDKRQLYDLYGEWEAMDDRVRGHRFARQHSQIQFFRDEPFIQNVKTESAAKRIFGMKAKHAYLMMLYSPWLTPAVEAIDVYRKVAQNLLDETGEEGIKLAAVNCESQLQSFCLRYGRLRNQYDLPVVLLVDPTEELVDRYRGRLSAESLVEYAMASDRGVRHVHNLDEQSFQTHIGAASSLSDFWLVLFCTSDEPMCREIKPVLKRLAYSARNAAKVGLVNCRHVPGADGYYELEGFCQEQGVQDVPQLLAYRRGSKGDQTGESIPLVVEGQDGHDLEVSLVALRALEAVLRLSAPAPELSDASADHVDEGEPSGFQDEL